MKCTQRTRLFLERLEDRSCPALGLSYLNGTLTLTGSPRGQLDINVGASNAVQVLDNTGAINYGTYRVTNGLRLLLQSHPDVINVNLQGNTFAGNVTIDLGKGDLTGPTNPVSVYGGTLSGSLTIQNGNGAENLAIGLQGIPATPVTITGNVIVTGTHGPGAGESLFVVPGSTIHGNLTATRIDNVLIDGVGADVATVRGNATIDDTNSPSALTVGLFGRVNGTLTVRGTNLEDLFFAFPNAIGGGVVGGNANFYFGSSSLIPDTLLMSAGSVVGGSLSVNGSGDNSLSFDGTIGRNAFFTLGNGNNSITFQGTSVVGGSVTTTGGNGTNTILITDTAVIGGSVWSTLGNGTNSFTLTGSAMIQGPTVSYRGGTFSDTVTITNGMANGFALNVTFSGGTRTVSLGTGISLASMTLDFGTGPGTKSLLLGVGLVITWPSTILNFP